MTSHFWNTVDGLRPATWVSSWHYSAALVPVSATSRYCQWRWDWRFTP